MQYGKRKKFFKSETELAPPLIFQKSLEKKKIKIHVSVCVNNVPCI